MCYCNTYLMPLIIFCARHANVIPCLFSAKNMAKWSPENNAKTIHHPMKYDITDDIKSRTVYYDFSVIF